MNLLFAFVAILLFCFSCFCISKMNQTSKEGDGDGNGRSPSCLTRGVPPPMSGRKGDEGHPGGLMPLPTAVPMEGTAPRPLAVGL